METFSEVAEGVNVLEHDLLIEIWDKDLGRKDDFMYVTGERRYRVWKLLTISWQGNTINSFQGGYE